MTALCLSLTLAALFVSSLGAALGLYAAAFMGVHDDIDPFLRDIHQQSEWAAWAQYCCRFVGHRPPNQTLSATSGAANGAGS